MERMMRRGDPTSVARHDAVVVFMLQNNTDCSVRQQSWGKGSVGFVGPASPPQLSVPLSVLLVLLLVDPTRQEHCFIRVLFY